MLQVPKTLNSSQLTGIGSNFEGGVPSALDVNIATLSKLACMSNGTRIPGEFLIVGGTGISNADTRLRCLYTDRAFSVSAPGGTNDTYSLSFIKGWNFYIVTPNNLGGNDYTSSTSIPADVNWIYEGTL